MAKLHLTMACDNYDRVKALADGTVKPENIEIIWIKSDAPSTFYRIVRFHEYDISEMSLSTSLMLVSRDKWGVGRKGGYTAIPVFPIREFFPNWSIVRADTGIETPKDLKGKLVGIAEYEMTAGLWNRGIIQHEYGVKPEDMEWYEERLEERIPYEHPVPIKKIPPGKTQGSMLLAGELDASIIYIIGRKRGLALDRSPDLSKNPKLKPLFPDHKKAFIDYYKKTGIMPCNHLIVIRNDVLEKNPWVAINLYQAFIKAKELCYEEWNAGLAGIPPLGYSWAATWASLAWDEQKKVFGEDPLPYGIKNPVNRKTLEAAIQYSYEQGLSVRKIDIKELFVESTLDL